MAREVCPGEGSTIRRPGVSEEQRVVILVLLLLVELEPPFRVTLATASNFIPISACVIPERRA